jgi:cell division protein FtsL
VGIVFFNVDVLRLNRSIASVSERATALKQENARLLLEEAKLASSDRIQQAAAASGMVLPAPGDVHFLNARKGDATRASQLMIAPQPVPPPAATPQTIQTPGTAAPPAGANGTTPGTTTGTGTTGTGTGTGPGTGTTGTGTTGTETTGAGTTGTGTTGTGTTGTGTTGTGTTGTGTTGTGTTGTTGVGGTVTSPTGGATP